MTMNLIDFDATDAGLDLHPEAPAPVPRKLPHDRRIWLALGMLAAGLLVLTGYSIARQGQFAAGEKLRAERAMLTAEQLCQQVRQLGAVCVADPSKLLRGEPGAGGPVGPPGPAGRAPTEAEIAAAVTAYLTANPPPAGEPGQSVTQAEVQAAVAAWFAAHPLPTCPDGWHPAEIQVRSKGGPVTILACVKA